MEDDHIEQEYKVEKMEDKVDGKNENKEGGGIITSLFSGLVHGWKVEDEGSDVPSEKENGVNHEEQTSGGGNIFSSIVSHFPVSLTEVEDNQIEKKPKIEKQEDKSDGKDEEAEGGIMSSLASDLVNGRKLENMEEDEKSDVQSANKENGVNTEEQKSVGGNIIDNIVSHLPTSLTDDVEPPTDEAAILIHSIIHD